MTTEPLRPRDDEELAVRDGRIHLLKLESIGYIEVSLQTMFS
jgi:hypothetical protein